MALTRSFPTQHPSGLPITDTRRLTAARYVRNADGTPRPGILPTHANPIVTGRASMGYDIAPFSAVTSRVSTGAEEIANDAVTTVTTTAAPGTNSRIDVIWVRSQFVQHGDANNDVVFGVAQGAAAQSPQKPVIPTGALELATATILSTTTTTATVAITQTHPYTASAGGMVWLRSATEQAAWNALDGAEAWRLDTKQYLTYLANATTPGWFHLGGKPTLTALTYTGLYGAGNPAPRLVELGGRNSLEGVAISSSASFAAGTYYQIGAIPADKAPVGGIQYAATLNGVFGGVSIASTGAVSFFSSVAFSGALSLYLGGASWPDKKL